MRDSEPLERSELRRVCEAILFAHDGPVTPEMVVEVIPETEIADVRAVMQELGAEYRTDGRSFEVVRVAGGYQICTREEWSVWVARFQRGKRRVRLSRAAVETLGIIAFRQPVTRTEVEDIRGVDTGGVIHTLLERNLIAVKGRAKTVGRPLLYATTTEFLEYFGLDTLDDLPQLAEIEELIRESADIMEEIDGEVGPEDEADSEAAEERAEAGPDEGGTAARAEVAQPGSDLDDPDEAPDDGLDEAPNDAVDEAPDDEVVEAPNDAVDEAPDDDLDEAVDNEMDEDSDAELDVAQDDARGPALDEAEREVESAVRPS